jgi:hypothetical protein
MAFLPEERVSVSRHADASQMRRAGKPTVTTKPGAVSTMARLADQEARHKNVLRPKGAASYDPKTREMRRLGTVVDELAKEQRDLTRAENAAADARGAVAARVSVLERAFGELADAVGIELDTARQERSRWRSDLESMRAVVAECASRTDACLEKCRSSSRTFDDREAARGEARAVLVDAERKAVEMQEQLQRLRDVARDADVHLQTQIDELRETVSGLDAGSAFGFRDDDGDRAPSSLGAGVTLKDILLAGAASEADVVALRDWAEQVASDHDERLREMETKDGERRKSRGKSAGGGAESSGGSKKNASKDRRRSDRSSEGSA